MLNITQIYKDIICVQFYGIGEIFWHFFGQNEKKGKIDGLDPGCQI